METMNETEKLREFSMELNRPHRKGGKIVIVTSGKGGVGKTHIALNLSLALTRLGQRVSLFDGDFHLSNLNVLLGIRTKSTLSDVLYGNESIESICFKDDTGLKIYSAEMGNNHLLGLESNLKERFYHEFESLRSENDLIFVDTSAGISESIIGLSLRADEVVIVTTPEPTAISDAYALIKILSGMKEGIHFKIILNLVKSEQEAMEVFERLSLVINHFLTAEASLLGHVLQDQHVQQAVQEQVPFIKSAPNCKASRCITDIAGRMVS